VGGSYDALMLRQQQSQQPTPGRYSGTAVPHVNGPSYSGYSQPQNWADPAVSGRDLIVHRDVLRQVAADLARMADQLQTTLSACAPAAALAGGAAGSWAQAQQLNQVMSRAHAGVTQFTGQLQQAHTDMAARLATSADRYDAAEQQITSLIHAATDPSATIIQGGGQDTPVQPGYGQNWTPQQRASYYRIQRLENMPGNSGPNWTGTYPITEDTDFSQGSAAGYTWEQVNTNTTKTLVDAAVRLVDELPEGTPADKVLKHWLDSARRDDAARGVIWPTVAPEQVGKSGTAWQIFPNFQIGHAVNNMLCYSARPFGYDPDKCIFEAAVYELYPRGKEPSAEWEYLPVDHPTWGSVLVQDFANMAAVQQGLKNGGFRGPLPNPKSEGAVTSLHRNLAKYMGTPGPKGLT